MGDGTIQETRMRRRDFLRLLGLGSLPLLLRSKPVRAFIPRETKTWEIGEVAGRKPLRMAREIRSICTYCSVGCGLIFYRSGDEVLWVEGDPDNPNNEGKVCPKGQVGTELLFQRNKLRLTKPLIRTGPKPPAGELLKARSQEELAEILRKYPPNFREATWDEAFRFIALRLKQIVDEWRQRTGEPVKNGGRFYCYSGKLHPLLWLGSAKLTNEEAYLARKLMTIIGSNNIDHQARKCHSTTVAGLAKTFGFGAQSQTFVDCQWPAVFLVFGGNPAEAHPVSMRYILKGRDERGMVLLVADPRYTRTASKAHMYLPFRSGSDIAFLYYIAHYALFERNPPVDQLPAFREYLERLNIDEKELEEFKEIVREYTVDEVSRITGTPKEKLREMARIFVENSGVTTGFKRFATIQWAMGSTQHSTGTQIIRTIAVVQLLLGNVGYPGGGVNPYRGHCNVQGATDLCVLAHILPGYIKLPTSELDVRVYQDWKNQGCPDAWHWKLPDWVEDFHGIKPGEEKVTSAKILWSWWFQGWRRFELTWGIFVGTDPEDDPQNGVAICDLPMGAGYTETTLYQGIWDGIIKAFICMGENPAVSSPDARIQWASYCALPLMVVVDIFMTETAYFADVVLPAACAYEKEGSKTNSPRWVQWQDRVIDPPGEAMADLWIIVKLFQYLRDYGVIKLPSEFAGKKKEKVLIRNPVTGEYVQLYERRIEPFFDYRSPDRPERDYREADPRKVYKELDLAVDLYYGQYDWVEERILAQRRDPTPRKILFNEIDAELDSRFRLCKNWGWSWPRNVRILYSRDSLKHTLGKTRVVTLSEDEYVVGGTYVVTGETGEMRDAKSGKWRPAFLPGHNFFIGKFYKRAWSGMTDLFTGYDPWKGEFIGKFVIFKEDGSYEIKTAEELGIKYPACESFYYDPELVNMGKASFKAPYFKGTKKVGDKTIYYVGFKEFKPAYEKLRREIADGIRAGKSLREIVLEMIGKYGAWYAAEAGGRIVAYDFRYPIHCEPAETPDKELAAKYPQLAWIRAENLRVIKDPAFVKEGQLSPDDMSLPSGAVPVVLTTFRLTEHFHTGAMTRNIPYLAELFPELFVEIPVDLAKKLGIKPGDWVAVGNNRAEIICRAMVTHRANKLLVNGRELYECCLPWHWGFQGLEATVATPNLLVPVFLDITTTMQESKAFIGYIRKL